MFVELVHTQSQSCSSPADSSRLVPAGSSRFVYSCCGQVGWARRQGPKQLRACHLHTSSVAVHLQHADAACLGASEGEPHQQQHTSSL
jgi:hypothetical protein